MGEIVNLRRVKRARARDAAAAAAAENRARHGMTKGARAAAAKRLEAADKVLDGAELDARDGEAGEVPG